jgi:transposase
VAASRASAVQAAAFIAKAERSNDAGQLELEFAEKLRELDALAGTLGIANDRPESDETPARDGKPRGKRTNNRGTGRRDLKELGLEEERIEIPDPRLEALVAQGKVVAHGFKLMHRRATKVLLVVARVRYKTVDAEGNADVITTVMPNEMLPGSISAATRAPRSSTLTIRPTSSSASSTTAGSC